MRAHAAHPSKDNPGNDSADWSWVQILSPSAERKDSAWRPSARIARRLAYTIGALVTVAAMLYFLLYARRYFAQLPRIAWGSGAVLTLLAALLLRLLSLAAFALAWRELLAERLDRLAALRVVLLTQLGKYLPGNFGQLAGRVELGRVSGIARPLGVRSLALEAAALSAAACVLGAAAWLAAGELVRSWMPELPWGRLVLGLGLMVTAFGVLAWLGRHLGSRPARETEQSSERSELSSDTLPDPKQLTKAVLLYGLFLLMDGSTLVLLGLGLFGISELPWGDLVGLYALAWLAGFLTPGAASGLGVRDLILLKALEGPCGVGAALGLTVAHRLVVTLGDGAAFPLGLLLSRWRASR